MSYFKCEIFWLEISQIYLVRFWVFSVHEARSCTELQTQDDHTNSSHVLSKLLADGLVANSSVLQVYNLVPDILWHIQQEICFVVLLNNMKISWMNLYLICQAPNSWIVSCCFNTSTVWVSFRKWATTSDSVPWLCYSDSGLSCETHSDIYIT